jgi:hypothetical protein
MSRPFGKRFVDWRRLPSTDSLLRSFLEVRFSHFKDNPIIITEKGTTAGEKRGGGVTWMHECLSDDFSLVAASDQLGT